MKISAVQARDYLAHYIREYRTTFLRLTTAPPEGAGFPRLRISPYAYSKELLCYLARDGAVIADLSVPPDFRGGPITIECNAPLEVKKGELGEPTAESDGTYGDTRVIVKAYAWSWSELVQRLTLGKVGVRDLDRQKTYFWEHATMWNTRFMSPTAGTERFFHYLELVPHIDPAAWDLRSVRARVMSDVRRDFVRAPVGGATILSGGGTSWGEQFERLFDRLSVLQQSIVGFEDLLRSDPDGDESLFHEYLKAHPVILDIYGAVESKPRFLYPAEESPLGKAYVEPDFLIAYPGNFYKLVELEKPGKLLATAQGQPRAGIGQAAFQIAEWRTFIAEHYENLKDRYPQISTQCSTRIVVSRTSERSLGQGRNATKMLQLYREQFTVDELMTYDDLLRLARMAYQQLAGTGLQEPRRSRPERGRLR